MTQKRKRKKKVVKDTPKAAKEENDQSEDDLDEEFLAMVDSARENDAKMKKRKKESTMRVNKLGRHTTFVSEEGGVDSKKPIHAGHNIEVVVLPRGEAEDDDDHLTNMVVQERSALMLSSDLGTQPSKTAMSFCRGSHRQNQTVGKDEKQYQLKRSRKMKYKV